MNTTEVILDFGCQDLLQRNSSLSTGIIVIGISAILLVIVANWANNKYFQLKKQIQEVNTMDEFYRQVIAEVKDLEKDFEERIKEAEQTGSFDTSGRSSRVADAINKLNIKYLEAKERVGKNKKGGILSRF